MKLGLKLGKKPARPGAMKLRLSDFVDKTKLPPVPRHFGHDSLVGSDWQVLGNDRAGDCVFAGAAHETMLWNRMAGRQVRFTDQSVLSDYSAVTGYNPNDPNTDNGTDMVVAAKYRQTTGILDADGNRHKIAAYLALNPGSFSDIWAAMYLFGAVGIGIRFPDSAMDQFDKGQEWTYVRGSKVDGGHYVPCCGKNDNLLHVVTWGRVQPVSAYFLSRYCDEAVAYVSDEALTNNKSLEGFDRDALVADLGSLTAAE